MDQQAQTGFSTGILLNLGVAIGLSWLTFAEIICIPNSLSWVVHLYITRTSYVTVQALLQTPVVIKFIKICLKCFLYCATLPFALAWQTLKILPDAVQRTSAQQSFKVALEKALLLAEVSSKSGNQTATTHGRKTGSQLSAKSTYQYQQLWDVDEIRLLQISPDAKGNDEQGRLRGIIVHARLSELPHFVALSYCWNDQEPSQSMENRPPFVLMLDTGESLVLTRNLFNGIQSARRRGHSESNLFWIDQICINQNDLPEKSSQVGLMKDIYTQAAYVLVWLGDDTETAGAARALRFAERIAKCIDDEGLLAPEFDFFPFHFAPNKFGLPPLYTAIEEYTLLMMLLTRPWFERSWVVQEVSLNSNKIVLCGDSETSFDAIASALLFCTKSLDFLMEWIRPEPKLAFDAMIQSSLYTRRRVAPPSSRLLDILVRHRSCSSTLASDKVYAFLNLSTDKQALSIAADYSVCSRIVFINTAVSILTNSDNLDILGSANAWPIGNTNGIVTSGTVDLVCPCEDAKDDCSNDDHPKRLPSWVPDWSVPQLASSFQFKGQSGEYFCDYRATGDSKKKVQFRRHRTELGLDGHVLDQVIGVGPIFTESQGQGMGRYYRVLQCWGDMCGASDKTKRYAFTHETMLEAFANTLTCGGIEAAKSSIRHALHANTPTNATEKDCLGEGNSFAGQLNQLWMVFRINCVIECAWPGIVQHTLIFNVLQTILALSVGLWYHFVIITGLGQLHASVSSGFRTRFFASVTYRRFIVTASGFIGLASPQVQPDDWVALFSGSNVPIVIRDAKGPNGYGTLWEIVGDCYMHGAMFGECFLPEDRRNTMWFC